MVETSCDPATPILSVSPSSQSANAGDTLTYSVSVTNADGSGCSASTFSLQASAPAGWSGGAYGTGARMSLKYTRAMLDAIHDGSLEKAPTEVDPIFGLEVPTACEGVPTEILIARNTWADKDAFDEKAKHLASLFHKNFEKFADQASDAIKGAGPKL